MFFIDGTISLQELIILPLAITIDLTLGELPEQVHPTVWMGRLAKYLESKLKTEKPKQDQFLGVILILVSVSLFSIPTYLLSTVLKNIHWILYVPVMTIFLKSTFSIRAMVDHVKPIIKSLKAGDLDEARRKTSQIVSRDTSNLSNEETISAAIESTGEGITDGIVAPIMYFSLLGVPGAIGYRVVNTLDSMYGYKDPAKINIGKAPAKLDTILNYMPARLSVVFTSIGAWIAGESWRDSLKSALKEGGKTESLNAGFPMAAVAGALNVRLEKKAIYSLGTGYPYPEIEHIERSLKVMKITAIVFCSVLIIILGAISVVW